MSCDLCKLLAGDVITRKYYTDKTVMIVDCKTCGIPMVVFNHCGSAAAGERRRAMSVINALFNYKSIRKGGRQILDHEHWHLEDATPKVNKSRSK